MWTSNETKLAEKNLQGIISILWKRISKENQNWHELTATLNWNHKELPFISTVVTKNPGLPSGLNRIRTHDTAIIEIKKKIEYDIC